MILDHSCKLQEWLFKIGDVFNLIDIDASSFKTKPNRMNGKSAGVLFATKSLFLGGGDNLTVF